MGVAFKPAVNCLISLLVNDVGGSLRQLHSTVGVFKVRVVSRMAGAAATQTPPGP